MTAIANAPASLNAARPSYVSSIGTALKEKWRAYIMWRMERAALMELSALSDRDLKDIGLARGSLKGTIRERLGHDQPISRYY